MRFDYFHYQLHAPDEMGSPPGGIGHVQGAGLISTLDILFPKSPGKERSDHRTPIDTS
jgi:hypothetical protein